MITQVEIKKFSYSTRVVWCVKWRWNCWLWRQSISLHRDHVGEHGEGLIYWGF